MLFRSNILTRNTQPNQSKVSFSEQIETLKITLNDININELSLEQQELLSKYDMLDSLGKIASMKIDDAAYINAIDIANFLKIIQEMSQNLNIGFGKITKIYDALVLVHDEKEYHINKYEAIMKVRFTGESAMSNIVTMKKLTNQWNEIGRGLCRVHGVAPETIEIIGTERGSIIFVFGASVAIVKTLSSAILGILNCVEKVYSIKKEVLEVKKLELETSEIERKLMEKAEEVKEQSIDLVIESLSRELNIENGEVSTTFKKAIVQLSKFLENDGEVDCYIPEIEEPIEDDENGQQHEFELRTQKIVNDNFKRIRELESEIKLLQNKN